MLRTLFFLAMLFSSCTQASPIHLLYSGQYPLTTSVSYHFTPDTKLELHELLNIEDDITWKHSSQPDINLGLGYGNGAFWLKTEIVNENELVKNWALEFKNAPLDQIEAYLMQNDEVIEYHLGGDSVRFSDKSIQYPRAIFPLQLEPNQTYSLYIRVIHSGPIQVPMTIWEWEKLNSNTLSDFLLQGLFLGFVIIMALYNFVVWLKERESVYLSYITYILCLTLFQLGLSGIGFQFIWPSFPELNAFTPLISVSLALASVNLFTRDLFDMQEHSLRLHTILTKLFYFFLIFTLICLFLPFHISVAIISFLALVNTGLMIFIAVYMLRIKHQSAHYFALAWSIVYIGTISLTLNKLGIIPSSFFSQHTLQIGAAFEIIILTLALAERMAISQKNALSLAIQVNEEKENTYNAQRESLILEKKAKEELERIVDERTQKLSQTLESLSIAHDKLQTISITDALTGLNNRYYFNDHFKIEYKRAFRDQTECSLIMLDIDHFKLVNDTYGHPAGDVCLKFIANCIKKNAARDSDICCRYGGEEFIIVLPSTSLMAAYKLADKIRESIKEEPVKWNNTGISLTASFGVSSVIPSKVDQNNMQYLVNQADQALYDAKDQGRDRVVAFNQGIL